MGSDPCPYWEGRSRNLGDKQPRTAAAPLLRFEPKPQKNNKPVTRSIVFLFFSLFSWGISVLLFGSTCSQDSKNERSLALCLSLSADKL